MAWLVTWINCGQTVGQMEMHPGATIGPHQGHIVLEQVLGPPKLELCAPSVPKCRAETTVDIQMILVSFCKAHQDALEYMNSGNF